MEPRRKSGRTEPMGRGEPMGNDLCKRRRQRRAEGGTSRPGTAAGHQDDTTRGGSEGMVHWAAHTGELHGQGYCGQME
eukprot:5266679-Heterocapsa_arctica.AAC.1